MTQEMFFAIESAAIFEVSGRHAARYLNNRLTNNVIKLQELAAHSGIATMRAGALSAQGKLEGLFTVIATTGHPMLSSTANFLLVCDAGNGDPEFLKALARFKVAEDVQFSVRSDLQLIHTDFVKLKTAERLSWVNDRGFPSGFDLLVGGDFMPPAVELPKTQRIQRRLVAGEPQFGVDFDSAVLLPETGLSATVSFTKGCYVGQEVIARIDALGKPPRVLRRGRILGDAATQDVTVVMVGEKRRVVGEITNSVELDGNQCCFVLLRNDEQVLTSKGLYCGERSLELL